MWRSSFWVDGTPPAGWDMNSNSVHQLTLQVQSQQVVCFGSSHRVKTKKSDGYKCARGDVPQQRADIVWEKSRHATGCIEQTHPFQRRRASTVTTHSDKDLTIWRWSVTYFSSSSTFTEMEISKRETKCSRKIQNSKLSPLPPFFWTAVLATVKMLWESGASRFCAHINIWPETSESLNWKGD